jgi:hypothetical protein
VAPAGDARDSDPRADGAVSRGNDKGNYTFGTNSRVASGKPAGTPASGGSAKPALNAGGPDTGALAIRAVAPAVIRMVEPAAAAPAVAVPAAAMRAAYSGGDAGSGDAGAVTLAAPGGGAGSGDSGGASGGAMPVAPVVATAVLAAAAAIPAVPGRMVVVPALATAEGPARAVRRRLSRHRRQHWRRDRWRGWRAW